MKKLKKKTFDWNVYNFFVFVMFDHVLEYTDEVFGIISRLKYWRLNNRLRFTQNVHVLPTSVDILTSLSHCVLECI